MMQYKKSEFNYVQEKNGNYLIYNTLYNSLVRLNSIEYSEYLQEEIGNTELAETFIDNGLWVSAELDERKKYLACSEVYTLNVPRPLSITVTTTLKCNARCAYCYEKGVKQEHIHDGMEEKILEFIRKHNDTNEVQMLWFGGEPLMNMEFMDSMSQLLEKEGISFASYMISNGSLLNKQIIEEKFPLWHLTDMQITLDGTKEKYEKIKNYKDPKEGEFYSVLSSIKTAAEKGIFVNIRLNIGRENRADILELLKELDYIFGRYENVVFYPAFLTGEKEPLSEEEKVSCVKEMLLSVKNIKKLTTGTKMYSIPRMHACMNGDPRSFSIDVNGNVYSCEHFVGRADHRMGGIEEDYKGSDMRGRDVKFREECERCVFLPKCYGGCEANYIEGDSPCMIEKYLIKAYLQIL